MKPYKYLIDLNVLIAVTVPGASRAKKITLDHAALDICALFIADTNPRRVSRSLEVGNTFMIASYF